MSPHRPEPCAGLAHRDMAASHSCRSQGSVEWRLMPSSLHWGLSAVRRAWKEEAPVTLYQVREENNRNWSRRRSPRPQICHRLTPSGRLREGGKQGTKSTEIGLGSLGSTPSSVTQQLRGTTPIISAPGTLDRSHKTRAAGLSAF